MREKDLKVINKVIISDTDEQTRFIMSGDGGFLQTPLFKLQVAF